MNRRIPSLILSALAGALAFFTTQAQAGELSLNPSSTAALLPGYMKGVNLSGAEYAPGPNGVFGTNYIYPNNQELDYYKSKGFSIIRLPFDIARVQKVAQQPLNQQELTHITAIIEYARQIGLYVILDPHNYGKMWTPVTNSYETIGTSANVPNYFFADFWSRLSTVYKNYPNVLYGLMNEPNIQDPTQWKKSAIRAVSTTQTILIPGTYFTTAATWPFNGNSSVWAGYRDPVGGPFMFEMHQYLDANYSGSSGTCVPGSGSSVLANATAWLAANGYKAFLGEFDWYNDFGRMGVVSAQCQTEGLALLQAMQDHPQQWAGWTWWGSGPWAWNNGVNLDPGSDGIAGDQPQTPTLLKFLNGSSGGSINNGSFEVPGTGGYIYNPSGAAWTFIGSAGIQRNGSAWGAPNAPDGVQTAFLQDGAAGGNGSISQPIYIPTAGAYSVSFKSALRAYRTSATIMSFKVLIDGAVVGTFAPNSTNMTDYSTNPINLTAGAHNLSFIGTAASGDTADFIDAVTVNPGAAPPPPSGILNGSFEVPGTGGYIYNPSGAAWTFIGNAGIQHNGSAWGAPNAPDGVQTAFLQDGVNGGNGSISQSFNVQTSGIYTLSFQAALRQYRTSPTAMSFNVIIDGTTVGSFAPTSTAFSPHAIPNISLSAGSHTLSFVGTGTAPDTSDFIDSVTLQ
jgi:endoglucanase